jgi:DNA-binding transcriptional ArsR family regulator
MHVAEMAERSAIHLNDPRAMRALAHPKRLRLLGLLRTDGPATVGALSDLLDEAPGSVSFHLGKLAEHGFIVEAPELARDGRERWWRAAHDSTQWEPGELIDDPERRAASGALRQQIWRLYLERLETWLADEPSWDREWVSAATSGDQTLHLTADELAELRNELEALSARWQARGAGGRPGTEAVMIIYHAFPRRSAP